MVTQAVGMQQRQEAQQLRARVAALEAKIATMVTKPEIEALVVEILKARPVSGGGSDG